MNSNIVKRVLGQLSSGSSNRGLFLDLLAFLLNLAMVFGASSAFRSVIRSAASDDPSAQRVLFLIGIAMFLLAPIGATLGRWHFYQRRLSSNENGEIDPMGGCIFNPIFYFCLNCVTFSAVFAFIIQTVYGKNEPNENVFIGSIFFGLFLIVLSTILAYRYFSIPKKPPRLEFFRNPISSYLSDSCLFLNMALFQQWWGLLGDAKFGPVRSVGEFFGRVFLLAFIALLIYFPPRMFYLAEDLGKKWAWISILLANAPIIVRFLIA